MLDSSPSTESVSGWRALHCGKLGILLCLLDLLLQVADLQLGLGDGLLLDGDLLILCVCIPERIKLLKKEYTDQKKLKKFKKGFVTNKILEEFYTRILQV